ncbi:MAG: Crp/Fnr family transcriptional regulator [Acidimicrobiia bacterium]|nr:Crp/Fnr family transcriptional regulator [Acidimicrobiia bacterium]
MSLSKPAMLKAIDLFASLPEPEFEHLADTSVSRQYAPGETLFLEGEQCQGLWVIGEGAVRVVKTTPQGRQLVLATMAAPSSVAEVPVFDGGPYPASVFAFQPTIAILVFKQDFLAACRAHPELALRFLRVFGKRLRHLLGLAERVTFGTIRQRLAQDLLDRARLADSGAFPLEETQEELAARLGTVREVVSRNLGRFQSEGLLRLDRRTVEILDWAGIENEAETQF